MNPKTLLANGMMVVGMFHMPLALVLAKLQGMSAMMSAFLFGLVVFWCGWYLRREFGD